MPPQEQLPIVQPGHMYGSGPAQKKKYHMIDTVVKEED